MKIRLVPRACSICGNRDEYLVFAKANFNLGELDRFGFASRKTPEYMHFRLILCPDCGLLYANPILPPRKIMTAYQQADFASQEEAGDAARTYGKVLDGFLESLPDRKGALDIGTGEGAFLNELLNRGFAGVIGVEPSKAPVKAAKPALRKLIRNKPFRAADYRKNSLSLVSCFQTLEHVLEPFQTAKAAYSLLKPGGAFFIVSHNRQAFSAKLLGRKSPIFDIEHLQLFSFKSARRLLQRAGFSNIRTSRVYNTYPFHYWVRLLPIPALVKSALLGWLKGSALGKLPLSLPAGNMMVVGYKS
ncbi:MAG: class I SAM-dependent methyltransferase [bacterium]